MDIFLGFRMPGAGFEPAISRYPRNKLEQNIYIFIITFKVFVFWGFFGDGWKIFRKINVVVFQKFL